MSNPVICIALVSLTGLVASAAGCAEARLSTTAAGRESPSRVVDPQRVQSEVMRFAEQYVAAMADAYDRAQQSTRDPQARIMAYRLKIVAGTGAMGNAVDPHPLVGLMDMAVMVTLTRQIAEEPWARDAFGAESANAILATLEAQEAEAWDLASSYLTRPQIEELHQLAARWREENPDQRYLAGARLADLLGSTHGGRGGAKGAAQQIAGGILAVVTLDPFRGLDPAVKEVAESRILAERLFFYLRHLPILVSWQADGLYARMLAEPQVVQLFADTTTVTGSTSQFSNATSRFADASSRLAQTVEEFRLQLPDQQAKLVAEMNDLVARQREGALQQAATQVSVQRDAAVQQLDQTLAVQQDLMTRNLQAITDQSIERAYRRARSLILITVGSVLLAFILYRRFAATRRPGGSYRSGGDR